jgi:hypothetical protein
MASGPVFIFYALGSRFHVLCSRTHFGRNRGNRVLFSCFVLTDSFWAVLRALGLVFMSCTLRVVLAGTEGVRSCFNILRSRICFRYRGQWIPLSCFALSDSFSVPRALSPLFQVLHSRAHFRRYRGCRVPFSCFELLGSFSAVPRVPSPVFIFLRS